MAVTLLYLQVSALVGAGVVIDGCPGVMLNEELVEIAVVGVELGCPGVTVSEDGFEIAGAGVKDGG